MLSFLFTRVTYFISRNQIQHKLLIMITLIIKRILLIFLPSIEFALCIQSNVGESNASQRTSALRENLSEKLKRGALIVREGHYLSIWKSILMKNNERFIKIVIFLSSIFYRGNHQVNWKRHGYF